MTYRGFVLGFVLVSATVAVVLSCGSDTPLLGVSQACVLNSDCASPLLCVFQRCHTGCAESLDCPMGERCVASGTSHVCQLPEESSCSSTVLCQAGQVCGPDQQCRTKCTTSLDCPKGDSCLPIGGTNACYSPNNPTDQQVLAGEGGVSSESGTAGGGDDASSGTPKDGAATDALALTCSDKIRSGDETDVDC